MQRRDFLATASAAIAGAAMAPPVLAEQPLRRIGLELYSVRMAMRKDPEGTLKAIKKMGYHDVELLWSWRNFDRTRESVKETLDRERLKAPAAHINPEMLRTGWGEALEDAVFLGHQYLIVPSLPLDATKPLESWREWADTFNAAGAEARRAGIWLAFHNEPSHQRPIDGVVPYDLFIERTDPSVVRLQLDCGNMAMGGGDPMAYLKAHTARYWSFHLKDVVPDRSKDTELGQGVLDLRAFIAAIPNIEQKPCFVEQEGGPDPMDSARRNFAYVKSIRG